MEVFDNILIITMNIILLAIGFLGGVLFCLHKKSKDCEKCVKECEKESEEIKNEER